MNFMFSILRNFEIVVEVLQVTLIGFMNCWSKVVCFLNFSSDCYSNSHNLFLPFPNYAVHSSSFFTIISVFDFVWFYLGFGLCHRPNFVMLFECYFSTRGLYRHLTNPFKEYFTLSYLYFDSNHHLFMQIRFISNHQ